MVYVARFTTNPEEDIKRGWSGWMNVSWENVVEAAYDQLVNGRANLDEEKIQGLIDDDLLSMLNDYGFDVRYDDTAKLWRLVHHDGLSCFRLNAETLEDALLEEHPEAFGEGDCTLGSVQYVAPVPGSEGWHIFECADTKKE